jgi:hypothetical protein
MISIANHLTGPDLVVAWASERDSMRRRYEAGEPWPWTFDPILSEAGSFTNVRREFDKTTRAYANLIRSRYDGRAELLATTTAFLWFNLPQTAQTFVCLGDDGLNAPGVLGLLIGQLMQFGITHFEYYHFPSVLFVVDSRLTVPVGYLRECFDYDPGTGELRWRARPEHHFKTTSRRKGWNKQFPSTVAGKRNAQGYLDVCIKGRELQAHRIIWALVTGEWPVDEIDHRNGIKDDNRFSNLREATHVPGVCYDRRWRRWRAEMTREGRSVTTGYFDTPEAAHVAYLAARAEAYSFQPVPR